MIRDDNGFDNRGHRIFYVFEGVLEELKSSPVSMMRIKYLTKNEDYVIKKEFQSELNNEVSQTRKLFHQ
jgi:hypothetical protein